MNSQVNLIRDLRKHVKTVNAGSEPFASALRSIEQTAWAALNSRGIPWQELGSKITYSYRVHTYISSSEGLHESYSTPLRNPDKVILTTYQKGIKKLANKAVAQYDRHCFWILAQFDKALDTELNGRSRLRCLTGRAKFEALIKDRTEEVQRMIAGASTAKKNLLGEFIDRHGQCHIYRDQMFATRTEAMQAMREDTANVPVDHDYVVGLYELAFPAGRYDEAAFDVLAKYMRSADHRDALKMSTELGGNPALLKRHDKVIQMVSAARYALAGMEDPLPPNLHGKLRVSKTWLFNLMKGQERTKESIMAALQEELYTLTPSKRPRKPTVVEPNPPLRPKTTLPPSMSNDHPEGCRCVRCHQEGGSQ